MKNLYRKKKTLTLRLVAAFAVALIQVPIIFGVRAFFPEFYGKDPMLFTVCVIIVFSLAGLIILVKTMNPFAIVSAMIKNEKRLKSDRKFWRSNNKNVSKNSVVSAFEKGGFTPSENGDGSVTLTRNGIWRESVTVYEDAEDPGTIINAKVRNSMRASSRYDKRAIAIIFLVSGITEEDKKLSSDASAIENGCVLPVFYDKSTDLAYYMGGDTGANTPEKPLQEDIKRYLLGVENDFAPKTDDEKTDEEIEFENLDVDEIFASMKKDRKSAEKE